MKSSALTQKISRLLPLMVLSFGLSLSYLIWQHEIKSEHQKQQNHLALQALSVVERFEQKMLSYEHLLRSVRSQFLINENVNRQQFHAYIQALEIDQNYAGVQGIAFIPLIQASEQAALTARAQAEGLINYQITPSGHDKTLAPALYIEPNNERNARVPGFNLFSEPKRRTMMEQARDQDRIVLSEKLTLAGEDNQSIHSVLMSLPIYQYGKTPDTIAERRDSIRAWVTCSFRMQDFVQKVLGENNKQFDVELYDGKTISPQNLLFDSNTTIQKTAEFNYQHTFNLGGRSWSLLLKSTPKSQQPYHRHLIILLLGCLISILLAWLTYLLHRSRKHAANTLDALQISEARLYATLDNSPFMIWQKDTEGKYTLFNKAFFNASGKKHVNDILGKTDFDIWPRELAEKYRADDAQVMTNRTQQIIEELVEINGNRHTIETCKTPVINHHGQVLGTTGFARDTSERQRAEAEYRTIIQTTPDGFWLANIHSGQLLDVNPAYCQMSGYSREELLQMVIPQIEAKQTAEEIQANLKILEQGQPLRFETLHRHKDGNIYPVEISTCVLPIKKDAVVVFVRDISSRKHHEYLLQQSQERLAVATTAGIIGIWDWDITQNILVWDEAMYRLYGIQEQDFAGAYDAWSNTIHPEDKAIATARIQDALDGIHEYHAEFRIIWPDQSIHYIKAAAHTQYDNKGRAIRMIGMNYDITEQKLAAQAIEQAKQAAEHANRAKSEFLANMSHEIRTPMNAIIGLSDLALSSNELSPKLHNYLDKIYNSSRALLSLINDILDYSKVEAGRLELDHVELHLGDLLENVTDLFNARADEKGIEIVLDIDPNLPDYVFGDSLRLGQILNNLVGNAVKFTEQGQVVVKVQQINRIDSYCQIRFAVSDTGIGMSAEHVSRLFQAFSQADSSITRRFGGSGLGLSISKKLVEKMGGDIQVHSQEGQGSCFSFEITLNISARIHQKQLPEPLRGANILVVDDLDASRLALSEILRSWNCQVSEAASGQQALGLLMGQHFSVVLLDWKMPGMDGLEVAKRIRELAQAQQFTKPPIVIMVTAYSKDALLQQIETAYLDAVLHKPITASGLLDTLSSLHEHEPIIADQIDTTHLAINTTPIHGAHILLVEDFETNQLVATDILQRMGVTTSVCDNGLQAIERLKQEQFDAILMDLQMPVMDGLSATRIIRQNPQWRQLPIIAMTAAAMDEDKKACFVAGMNDHVAKPIMPQQLANVLLRWVKPAKPHPQHVTQPTPLNTLPNAPGFDFTQTLQRLGNNQHLLFSLLNKFTQQFQHSNSELQQLLASNNFTQAAHLVHAIKGAAANLGAIRLANEAIALELQLKRHNAEIETFNQALLETITIIQQLGPKPATENAPQNCSLCQWQHIKNQLEALRSSISASEYISLETLNEIKKSNNCPTLQQYLDALEQDLDHADYANALILLDEFPCPKTS